MSFSSSRHCRSIGELTFDLFAIAETETPNASPSEMMRRYIQQSTKEDPVVVFARSGAEKSGGDDEEPEQVVGSG